MPQRSVTVARSWADVPASAWDALVGEGSPFLEHAFLWAMEDTGCATAATGWTPRPVLVHEDGVLVAGAPCWLKTHSMGEFVYDHGWAASAQRAGLAYYPKLVVGVPFTPVTGERLLGGADPERRAALLRGIAEAGREARGVHVLFDTAAEAEELTKNGLFSRIQFQFWWRNEGFQTYDDFLQKFPSKHRNKMRRERKEVGHLQIGTDEAPSREVIDALYGFYADTTDRHYYGQRYLSRQLFHRLHETWRGRIVPVVARDGAKIVAGAFNVRKGKRLYGRYWGTNAEMPFLHFEVCYHQGIEYAIAQGLDVFEPGHGGEHKYRRGFLPEITWSSHRFADPRLQDAFARYSAQEAAAVRAEIVALREQSPLRE
jgi:predicted N-acyltransferase